ncbi:MAG: hypothetical protein MI725_06135 [Pirellulales bacterium]|nr:hypothetical protein [Pirellulales bacterium]
MAGQVEASGQNRVVLHAITACYRNSRFTLRRWCGFSLLGSRLEYLSIEALS